MLCFTLVESKTLIEASDKDFNQPSKAVTKGKLKAPFRFYKGRYKFLPIIKTGEY